VDYEVRLDRDGALVGVVYLIDEGPWLRLRTLDLSAGGRATVPADLTAGWDQLASTLAAAQGRASARPSSPTPRPHRGVAA
jgi:hypothetical protein